LRRAHHLSLSWRMVGTRACHRARIRATVGFAHPTIGRSPEQLIQRRMIRRCTRFGMQSAERFHLHPGIDSRTCQRLRSAPRRSIRNGCDRGGGLDRELDAASRPSPPPQLRPAAGFEIRRQFRTRRSPAGGIGRVGLGEIAAMILQHADAVRRVTASASSRAANVCRRRRRLAVSCCRRSAPRIEQHHRTSSFKSRHRARWQARIGGEDALHGPFRFGWSDLKTDSLEVPGVRLTRALRMVVEKPGPLPPDRIGICA